MSAFGRCALLCLLGLGACDRTKAGAPASAAPTEVSGASVEASFLEATAVGGSDDEARGLAQLELARGLLGDPAWLEIVPLDLHDATRDPARVERLADGRVRATFGLSRARAAELLSAFAVGEVRVQGPAAWSETLQTCLLAHVASIACERRRSLFGSECEAVDASEADTALVELLSTLSLAPAHLGGVPLDAKGRPLRAPGAYALWRGIPTEGIPLVARWAGDEQAEPMASRSDARGQATFAFDVERAWPGSLTIAVDTRALLGPLLADGLPEIRVSIDGRPAGLQRWGAVVVESGSPIAAGPVLDGLADRLGRHGLGRPVEIPGTHAQTLARGDKTPQQVMALGDALGGRIDVVFVVQVESRFANRMGGTRVWYEARGKLEVYEAWSGRLLTTTQTTSNGSGLGNERADEASRRALGEALAEQVLQSIEVPKPGASVAFGQTARARATVE